MRYTIEIYYQTGNSFGSHSETDQVPITWEKFEVAKLALDKLGKSYDLYQERARGRITYETYTKRQLELNGDKYETALTLPLDDGTEQKIEAYWIGYFEALHEAKLIIVGDEIDYKYTPSF